MYTLTRNKFTADGIFGELEEDGELVAYTLEHAFEDGTTWNPILPAGKYTLQYGPHQLEHGPPFMTYEFPKVTSWDGNKHTQILFHAGNFNSDSKGCVLLGTQIGTLYGRPALISSTVAFEKFITRCAHATTIEVEVVNP